MNSKLDTHLGELHGRAVHLKALCEALETMTLAEAGNREIVGSLCSVAVGLAYEVEQGLDVVNLPERDAT